MVRNF